MAKINKSSIHNDINDNKPDDELGTGLAVLSFCIPIAGALIYFSNKDKSPPKS